MGFANIARQHAGDPAKIQDCLDKILTSGQSLQALIDDTQKHVSGTVRVKLYKGGLYVAGRKSRVSLYNPQIATMDADPTKAYNQDDATGFIRLNALRLKVAAKVHGQA